MKVPNKVLHLIYRLAQDDTTVLPGDKRLVVEWAKAGLDKREADAQARATSAPLEDKP